MTKAHRNERPGRWWVRAADRRLLIGVTLFLALFILPGLGDMRQICALEGPGSVVLPVIDPLRRVCGGRRSVFLVVRWGGGTWYCADRWSDRVYRPER